MTNIGREAITGFVLSDRKFLELAFEVEEAMLGGPGKSTSEGVRELLIKAVLEALREHVRSQLDAGWEIKISITGHYPLAQWGALTIRWPGWPKLRGSANDKPLPVEIRLANDQGNWQRVLIGFVAPRFEFTDPSRASLTDAQVMFPNVQANDFWAAVEYPSNPFSDWGDKRFLIDIGYAAYVDARATQPREIKELGDHLVGIAQAAAKAVPVEWSAQPTNS